MAELWKRFPGPTFQCLIKSGLQVTENWPTGLGYSTAKHWKARQEPGSLLRLFHSRVGSWLWRKPKARRQNWNRKPATENEANCNSENSQVRQYPPPWSSLLAMIGLPLLASSWEKWTMINTQLATSYSRSQTVRLGTRLAQLFVLTDCLALWRCLITAVGSRLILGLETMGYIVHKNTHNIINCLHHNQVMSHQLNKRIASSKYLSGTLESGVKVLTSTIMCMQCSAWKKLSNSSKQRTLWGRAICSL